MSCPRDLKIARSFTVMRTAAITFALLAMSPSPQTIRAQGLPAVNTRVFLPLLALQDHSMGPGSQFEITDQFGGRSRSLVGVENRIYMDIGPRIARFDRQEHGEMEMQAMSPVLASFVHRLGVSEELLVALLSNGRIQVLRAGEDDPLELIGGGPARSDLAVSAIRQVLVDTDRLLFAGQDSIDVYDLTDPTAPRFSARILPESMGDCAYFGGIALYQRLLVSACGKGLYVHDIVNPESPHELGRHLEIVENGLPTVGVRSPVIVSHFVLVTMSQVRMQWAKVIDLSDPSRPKALERQPPSLFDTVRMESDGSFVYAIDHQDRLSLLSIDESGRARVLHSLEAPPGDFLGVGARKVFFRSESSVAPVDVETNELGVHLAKSTPSPRFLCHGRENFDLECFSFENQVVSVSDSMICVLDIQQISNASALACGTNPLVSRRLAVEGGADGLWISDGDELIFMARHSDGRLVAESSLWLDRQDGFRFGHMRRVGNHLLIVKSASTAEVLKERIEVHDITRSSNMVLVATIDRSGALSTEVVEGGGRVWLTTLVELLELDLRDPSAPKLRKRLDLPPTAAAMSADGDRLYRVSHGQDRSVLWTIDIADPEHPTLGAPVELAGSIRSIRVSDGIATFVSNRGSAHAVDVSTESEVDYHAVLNRPSYAPSTGNRPTWREVVWSRNGRFALTDQDGGLVIFRIKEWP